MPLIGGQAVPAHRLGVIFRHTLAVVVHQTEEVLGVGVPLIGGQPVPARRLGVIFRHTLAVVVHQTEVVLGVGVPLIGQRFPFFQCSLSIVVLRYCHTTGTREQ